MTVSSALDRRFREAAASQGLLDVAYDFAETPVGTLLLAATDHGLCRVSFDPEPDDPVRRQLDEYFSGKRRRFEVDVDLRSAAPFSRTVLERLAKIPHGEVTTYGALARAAGHPRAARAVGTVMNRNPVPIVLPCHRVIGADGRLVGYGGGLDRKRHLLTLEGFLLDA
jgi:methylated-DNA-[protein]-cysteine S-methyltransferase